VSLAPTDVERLGLYPGDAATVRSRRGTITALVRRDPSVPRGSVFMPFAYAEAAANLLTNPKLDPFGKIPEYKYCAVAVAKAYASPQLAGYGLAADLAEAAATERSSPDTSGSYTTGSPE
jgi:formate dehydrogenase major subunit